MRIGYSPEALSAYALSGSGGACQGWWTSLLPSQAVHLTSGKVSRVDDLSVDSGGSPRNRHATQSTASLRPSLTSAGITCTSGAKEALSLPSAIAELFTSSTSPDFVLSVESTESTTAGREFVPLTIASATGLYTDRPLAFRGNTTARSSRGLEEWFDAFEDGSANWTANNTYPNPLVLSADADSIYGANVARLTVAYQGGVWYATPYRPILSNTNYRISGSVRWVGGKYPQIAFVSYTSGDSVVDSLWCVGGSAVPSSGLLATGNPNWQRDKYRDVTPGATATKYKLAFQLSNNGGQSGSDDSSFDRIAITPTTRGYTEKTIPAKTTKRLTMVVGNGTTRTIYVDGVSAGAATISNNCDFTSSTLATLLGCPSPGSISSVAIFTPQDGQAIGDVETIARNFNARLRAVQGLPPQGW